jgi:hypothetical protein
VTLYGIIGCRQRYRVVSGKSGIHRTPILPAISLLFRRLPVTVCVSVSLSKIELQKVYIGQSLSRALTRDKTDVRTDNRQSARTFRLWTIYTYVQAAKAHNSLYYHHPFIILFSCDSNNIHLLFSHVFASLFFSSTRLLSQLYF